MFSVTDFEAKYLEYGDVALYEIYSNPDDYSPAAVEAAMNVIARRGGVEVIKGAALEEKMLQQETARVRGETRKLAVPGVDLAFLQGMIKSEILCQEDLNVIVASTYVEIHKVREDEKIKPRTVVGGVIGAIISGFIGGILLGVLMLQGYPVMYIFLVALFFLNYFLIRAITKQTSRNTFVLVSSILSVVLALAVGGVFYTLVMASLFSD